MSDARNLVWHLRSCFNYRSAVTTAAADAKHWYLALGELVRQGALDAAVHVAPTLRDAFPNSGMIARLALFLATMPEAPHGFVDFSDDSRSPVQVCHCGNGSTLILAFCGRHGNLGMPLPIASRWFGHLGANVVFLRDLDGELYLDGIPALAPDRQGSVAALRALCDQVGAERWLCYGNSTGAYAALLYGLDLGAAAVLALNMAAVFPEDRYAKFQSVSSARKGQPANLAPLYAAAPRSPRARLVYSAGNRSDQASAATMVSCEGVTIEAVPDHDGHDVQVALVARGLFLPLLLGFMDEWRGSIPLGGLA